MQRVLVVLAMELLLRLSPAQRVSSQMALTPDLASKSAPLDLSSAASAHRDEVAPPNESKRADRYSDKKLPPLFNEKDPASSGNVVFTRHISTSNYDPLPVNAADLVAVGRVGAPKTFLNGTKNAVYTTFDFSPSQIFKGTPNSRSPLKIDRIGGLVHFPSGKTRFVGIANYGLPVDGYTYLLFLKAVPGESNYNIIGGYALDNGHAVPLDQDAARLSGMPWNDLISRINDPLSRR